MARLFGPPLSAAALRALPFIRSGVARGLSANRIAAALEEGGLGIRRTDLLSAVRAVRGEGQAAERLKFIRKDRQPDPLRLAPAITKTLRQYSFVARVQGALTDTGERETRYVTISTSRLRNIGDLEDLAASLASDPEAYAGLEVDQVDIVSAVTAGGEGTLL